MEDRIVYQYKLNLLSPLHIGDGKELAPVDYCKINNNLYIIDPDRIFADQRLDEEAFINQVRKYDDFHWHQFNTTLPQEYNKYKLKIADPTQFPSKISTFIKTTGDPYIPGSSFKGALRTLILKMFVSRMQGNDFKNSLEKGKEEAESPREMGNVLEKKIFGSDPTTDFMKGIEIKDSSPTNTEQLNTYNAKTIKQKKYKMEVKFWSNWAEFLSPETQLKGKLILDWDKIKKAVKKEKNQKPIAPDKKLNILENIIDNLPRILNSLGQMRAKKEINYFGKHDDHRFEEIVSFYRQLKQNNTPVIRLGRFNGYMDKSIGDEINREGQIDLLDLIGQYYDHSPRDFPVTRILLQANKNGETKFVYPPGWAEIELKKLD